MHDNDDTDATETAASYQYRDAPDASIPFSETVRMLQQAASDWYCTHTNGSRVQFNVCLLNFYETGQQRIGWHADREELGRTTPIASISLGAPRTFLLRSKTNGVHDRSSLVLQPGSLVVMENQCQLEYVHSIPKEDTVTEGRINLTFRCKTETTAGEVAHAQRDTWLDRLVADSSNNGTTTSTEWKKEDEDSGATTSFVFGDGVPHGPSATPATQELLRYIVTTNLGAERYCAAELLDGTNKSNSFQVIARPWGWDGCVGLFLHETEAKTVSTSPAETITETLLQLRSAQLVLQFHAQFELLKDLEGEEVKAIPAVRLYEYVKQQLVDGSVVIPTVRDAKTFRVSCERIGGPHGFQSVDVEL